MSKRKYKENYNRKGAVMTIVIRDSNYKLVNRTNYNLNDAKALYDLLMVIEKFSPHTINQIIKFKTSKWI